jgi:hypothetical protein
LVFPGLTTESSENEFKEGEPLNNILIENQSIIVIGFLSPGGKVRVAHSVNQAPISREAERGSN